MASQSHMEYPASAPGVRDEPSARAARFDRPLALTPSQDLRGYVTSKLGHAVLLLITLSSVLAVLLIFAYIAFSAAPFFAKRGVGEFFRSVSWLPKSTPAVYGALSMFYGSAVVTTVATAIAGPLGLAAAIFLSDIVAFRVRQVVKPIIEVLAAIPSVALGFFALMVVAPWMQQHLGFETGTNALNAGLLLAVMALPTVVSVSEDALTAVGRELREGAYALGATRAETTVKVVVPAAMSGILAAVILGVMRAVGETMVVWMASGNATQIPHPWWDLAASVRTLTATIAMEQGETAHGSLHYQALFALGLILLVFTFLLNLASEHFLSRSRRLAGGKVK